MLDCYAILDIYICVGFFLVQTIIDCNRSSKKELTRRYRYYSLIKIMNKTDDYIKQMKGLSEDLNKIIQNYTKDKSSSEYINIENTLKNIEEKLKKYESKSKENNNKINIHIIPEQPSSGPFNINIEDNMTNLNNEQNNKNKNPETTNNFNIKEKQEQKVEINESATEKKKKPKDPVLCNKKYKKYIRRIDKLSLLYKEIDKETKEDEKQIIEKEENPKNKDNNSSKNCCTGIILFVSYFIAIISDFLLPIFFQYEDNYIDEQDNYKKRKIDIRTFDRYNYISYFIHSM